MLRLLSPIWPLTVVFLVGYVHAIGQQSCVSFESLPSSFSLVNDGDVAPVFISSDDWPGVQKAAADFASDVHKVTGVTPKLSNTTFATLKSSTPPILIGTLGKSSLISQIVEHAKLDVTSISGQWESFMSLKVVDPIPGLAEAYVIIGSDKRGTIFALYDHSEQIGVSPWYWWADVPATRHRNLFLSASGCQHGPPTVQYRGIFLNDEQPALQNWAMEKFTNGTGSALLNSPFNHLFYTALFELLLRLKANYLWPAQWSSAFNVDDPLNQPLADLYGIVMGTSHEEPMMRSIPNEWSLFGVGPWNYSSNAENVYDFWVNGTERAKPYESLFTIGMRGNGDLPLSVGVNIDLLEQVVSDQRQILSDVFNGTDVTTIPQVWTLYEEVEGYYQDGMRVPDDVCLLWTDDTWGNVRRYPVESERNRTGGAGVYYHFDLVGPPRDYKWITTSQISKTYEQMSLAVDRNATRIWVVNVGDLKPYELSTEFFITLGWNATRWSPFNLDSFVSAWAQREFDLDSSDAAVVSDIIANVTRWNARCKPELLDGTTYSLTDYREAEDVLSDWAALSAASTRIYNKLPADAQPAFFELVHHPALASSNLGNMWVSQGLNNLRASQARLSTNALADKVESLFAEDWELENTYHTILDGKWDHMMDQTHVMYYYWQQPMTNSMPSISRVQPKKQALPGPMRVSPEGTWDLGRVTTRTNAHKAIIRYFDIGAGGPYPFTFAAASNTSWLKLTPSKGSISPTNTEIRVEASVDWSKITGAQQATINFTATAPGQPLQLTQAYFVANHTVPQADFKGKSSLVLLKIINMCWLGFVEGDGGISIEAAHATRNTSLSGVAWTELPGYGKTLSGVTPWPRTGNSGNNFTIGSGPSLEYDFFNFNTAYGNNVNITVLVSPSFNANGDDQPLAFAVQVDSQTPQRLQPMAVAVPGGSPAGWDDFVANSIIPVNLTATAAPGAHTLKIWMIEPAVVIQKIVINTGNVRPSYLGPPESILL
ncbi:glycoside hydrolase family 115 protein [Athelia psychrophila]|uniref:Glycoside hydrolase family 115 protein n=1 Tax=Athelia psychrophila TaxID=1759441 RepID=A0A165XR69_9AGAM|nr:glycoside hydrolase family 115 protein [Fibularhizoctonia sp. CBS 109695]